MDSWIQLWLHYSEIWYVDRSVAGLLSVSMLSNRYNPEWTICAVATCAMLLARNGWLAIHLGTFTDRCYSVLRCLYQVYLILDHVCSRARSQ